MVKKEVIAELIDKKKAAILRVLLSSSEEQYLKEISEKSQVPLSSTFRLLQGFTRSGLVTKRVWKTSTLYSCGENDKGTYLRELLVEQRDGLNEFLKMIEKIPLVQQVILHGSRKNGKANVLLIGNSLPIEEIEAASQHARSNSCDLSYVTLTPEQFQQMARMGLYAGEKKVLLSRMESGNNQK